MSSTTTGRLTPDEAGLVFVTPTAYADEARFHEACRVLADLLAQIAAGTLRVPVELVPLDQAGECHRRILERGLTGKLVLDARA